MDTEEARWNLAKELVASRDSTDEWEDEPSQVEVRPRQSEVVSFRLSSDELDALESAAKVAGESISEFLRTALTIRLPQRIEELEAELADARNEITRHHQDFERWEAMAAKGAGQTQRVETLETENKRLRETLERARDRILNALTVEGSLRRWAQDCLVLIEDGVGERSAARSVLVPIEDGE